jgi:hypothetical protein
MSTISIGNAMRAPKVTTGNADQYASMRIYDPEAQVCPIRSNFDDYGRWAAHDSINTYAPGCYSAMDRIDIENSHRPGYSEYLNAWAINYPGVGYSDRENQMQMQTSNENKPYYDTQLGHTFSRGITGEEDVYVRNNQQSIYGVDQGIGCFMDSTYQNRSCNYYQDTAPQSNMPPM